VTDQSKLRINPEFPGVIQNLAASLGVYWRELATAFNRITDEKHTWTRGQRGLFVTLTSTSGSIAVDLDKGNNFNHTLTENTTLAAPSNAVAGQAGFIEFTQHASTPKTLTFNTFWKFPGGTDPSLTVANSALDVLSYTVNSSGASATCVLLPDVK